MKLIVLTFVLALFSSSLALQLHAASKAQLAVHNLQLDKISSLGSALKGLIQLAEVSEFEEVINILAEIRDEFGGILGKTRDTLNEESDVYAQRKDALQKTITDLENKIKETEQSLSENQGTQTRLNEAIQANVKAITEAEAARDLERERRNLAEAAFKQQVVNIGQALSVLGEAREIIEKLQAADLGKVGFSFIQSQKRKFTKQLSLVQEKISLMQIRTSPLAFYVSQLVEIAQNVDVQGGVNADLISRILILLNDFEGALQSERDEINQANEDDDRRSKQMIVVLTDTIQTQRSALGANQLSLEIVNARIATLTAELESLNSALVEANTSLKDLEQAFLARSQTLQGYIARLEKDVDVLERALAFVRSENNQFA